jgi:hypothetical protein
MYEKGIVHQVGYLQEKTPFVYYSVIVLGQNKALLDSAYQTMCVCHLSLLLLDVIFSYPVLQT